MKRNTNIQQYEKVCRVIGDYTHSSQILPFRTICEKLHCDYGAVEEVFLSELGMTGEDYLTRLRDILPDDEPDGTVS